MGKSADQIREEIDAQRAETGAKVDDLQHQVQAQVEGARQQVTDTVGQVRDEANAMVNDTIDSVKKSVEDLDIEGMVQERPLVAVGTALLGGFLLGALMGSGSDDNGHRSNVNARQYSSDSGSSVGTAMAAGAGSFGNTLRDAARKSGLEDTISNAGAALMGSLTDQIKEMVDKSFPGFSDKLDTVVNEPGSFKDKISAAQNDTPKH